MLDNWTPLWAYVNSMGVFRWVVYPVQTLKINASLLKNAFDCRKNRPNSIH